MGMLRQEEEIPCRIEKGMMHDEFPCEQVVYSGLVGVCTFLDIYFVQYLLMKFDFTAAAKKSSMIFRIIYPMGYLRFIFCRHLVYISTEPRIGKHSIHTPLPPTSVLVWQRVHLFLLKSNSSGIFFCCQFSHSSSSNHLLCPENILQILFLLFMSSLSHQSHLSPSHLIVLFLPNILFIHSTENSH